MLSFSLAASTPAEPVPLAHHKERHRAWWRKGYVQLKAAFPAAVIWLTNKPEFWDWPHPKHPGCEVCSREDGDPPAAGDSCQPQRGWESKHEISLSLWQASGPHCFRASPSPPRVSFHVWEQIRITFWYKTWSGIEENPCFVGNKPTMGSAKSFVVCLAGPRSLFFLSSAQQQK